MTNRNRALALITFVAVLFASASGIQAQDILEENEIKVEQAGVFELALLDGKYVTYLVHDVIIRTSTGLIYCDSAILARGEYVNLKGNVIIDDSEYKLSSDSAFYDITTKEALALGKKVELWSYVDSVYAAGPHAFYNRRDRSFYMEQRPILYINYPDTTSMIEIIADRIDHIPSHERAEALGNVIITSTDFSASSGCAVMDIGGKDLDLFENPRAVSGHSEITGSLISILFDGDVISKIDVIDSANGELKEAIDSLETDFDRSVLSGHRMIFDFIGGVLRRVKCYGQAYSWYYPSSRGGKEFHQNTVSGDTIVLGVQNKAVSAVTVQGGAVGTYIGGDREPPLGDTTTVQKVDTVEYSARYIEYNLVDSMITLREASVINSGTVTLRAHDVYFDTDDKIIEALSADVKADTLDTALVMTEDLQPNAIPVVLKDGDSEILGDYLKYSIESEKGRLIQSKSDYEEGFYYGEKLFREQKHIFYVDRGRYTTCDAGDPHFYFYSPQMKMIQDDKLIARPVVFYLEKLPLAILPYYVFPLKRGRHSGLLPFTFGKFQRGDRYVNDLGYYWAASEYWDMLGAFDYHEKNQTITLRAKTNFNKRYVLNGYVTGDYARETSYDNSIADEIERTRWVVRGAYNHTITPSFNVRASGDFQSDKSYYSDYSQNIDERLNRLTKSSVNFSKKFGKSTSLSGSVSHTVNLDQETRNDLLPSLNLSLPTVWLFGSGGKSGSGNDQSWYQRITFRYSPSMQNISNRSTVIDTISYTYDTLGAIVSADTAKSRSRREYAKINHNPALNLPTFKPFTYLVFSPRISYSETWFKIFETDQSLAAGIDATTTYRTYSYNGGASLRTSLYGTIHPNVFGLTGFRQVITPQVSYSWSPEIDRHPQIRSFAGGGAGSRKSSSVTISLEQLYQAKIQKGEAVTNLDNLLSIRTSTGYNFEAETKPWSSLTTSFQSSVMRNLSVDGSLTHTFYDPENDDFDFWSPVLTNFSFNARFNLTGSRFIFDEGVLPADERGDTTTGTTLGADPYKPVLANAGSGSGWSLSMTYSFNESGREEFYRKQAFMRFNLSFNLTPTTRVAYSQSYNILDQAIVNNSVNIVRKIHCWTGSLYWVPVGSNRGFGFKLFVTALPEIKLDNAHDSFLETLEN
ncbi:MAG: putative LPS assembly protein LptD [bacterium]|nr:putative LPS assembly protein LptD [bacterium]